MTTSTKADARERAVRTLRQGFSIDLTVILGALAAAAGGQLGAPEAAGVIGASIGKTLATAGVSWLWRHYFPPAAVQPDTGEHVAP